MDRKIITHDSDIIDALNKKRLDGETWNEFFRRKMEQIPKRREE